MLQKIAEIEATIFGICLGDSQEQVIGAWFQPQDQSIKGGRNTPAAVIHLIGKT
jgi:hypothetical protein